MTLRFLGTRGYVDVRSARHRMHAALLIVHRRRRLLIDCGEDWLGRAGYARPEAILVTHAHPDHAGGLREGSPCPVHATAEAWRSMRAFGIAAGDRRTVVRRTPFRLAALTVEAFAVVHSVRAPAVGYRIDDGRSCVFYAPDLVAIRDRAEALRGVRLYVGDGASLVRPLVRRRGHVRFGHASIRTQLDWCRQEGVRRAVFTHCGTAIVGGNERAVRTRLRAFGRERDVAATLAYDGLEIVLR